MTAIDVVANIEKADKAGGATAAYDVFKKEVDAVNRNYAPGERDNQLAQLTGALNQKGILPEISLLWAQEHKFEIASSGDFNRHDLAAFKKNNDAVSRAMADSLLNQYDTLRHRSVDWGMFTHGFNLDDTFGGYDRISRNDLKYSIDDLKNKHEAETKEQKVVQSAGELARSFDTEGGSDDFFKKLAKCDGKEGGISYWDVRNMLQADKLAGGMLTEKERKIVETLNNDWTEPYVQKLMNKNQEISIDTLKANSAALAKAEAAEHSENAESTAVVEGSQSAAPEGFMGAIGASIATAAKAVAEAAAQRQQVDVQPGDGFDRIARRALLSQGLQPSAAQVIEYSKKIAEHNNMNRDTTVLLTSSKLYLPKFEQ